MLSSASSAQLPTHGPQPGKVAGSTTAAARGRAKRHWKRGVTLLGQQNWTLAAQAFDEATQAAPEDDLYWLNLANALRRTGDLQRALEACYKSLNLNRCNPVGLRLAGDLCISLHRYQEGCTALELLEATGQTETESMLKHGWMLHALFRFPEASGVILRALALDPRCVRGYGMLAEICRDQGLKRESLECMKTVLALEPDNLEALSRMSLEKRHLCDWTDFDADLQALHKALLAKPDERAVMAAAFALLSLPLPAELQLKAAKSDALTLGLNAQLLPALQPSERKPGRIRLGLVSFDFREHPVAQLLVPVLEQIDRQRFQLFLYSSGPDDHSELRQRAVALADDFVELSGLSDEQAAQRVHADGVDLLIDLMGHTRGARHAIFARKPAPLQVAFLGFPGSTGNPQMDYLVGDPYVTPLELAHCYSEKLAQLPLTMQPNGRDRPLPQSMTRAQAGLPEDAFVICAFNHTYKIGPEAFDTWCSLLCELPHAVLWLRETNAQFHSNVLRAAAERGVAADRIFFAPIVPYADHFSRLALADIFVDTWPYGAHTTASDALWAGVPVVTHYGQAYASRVAASVVNAAGVAELAFANVADYRCAILALALEPALLATYREHLVKNRAVLPLFDTTRYTGELMDLFERMFTRWRNGMPCEHLLAGQPQDLPCAEQAAAERAAGTAQTTEAPALVAP